MACKNRAVYFISAVNSRQSAVCVRGGWIQGGRGAPLALAPVLGEFENPRELYIITEGIIYLRALPVRLLAQ